MLEPIDKAPQRASVTLALFYAPPALNYSQRYPQANSPPERCRKTFSPIDHGFRGSPRLVTHPPFLILNRGWGGVAQAVRLFSAPSSPLE
jgi:hypothetical protein